MIRMGLHRHTGKRDAELRAYVDAVRPQFVKFLDGFPADLAAFCHERGTRVIGRVYIERQELGAGGGRQVREVLDTARRNPHVDYWELHNEAWQGGNDLARYSELSIEFMQGLDAIGRKAAIGCFSTGQPEVAEWARFIPALRHAASHGHAVAVHEYGGGPVGAKWGVGRNQWHNGQPVTDDPCDDPSVRYLGWWCLRYRRAVDEWRRLGLTVIPDILITEALIDDVQPRPGPQGKGWRDFRGQHPAHVGDYADQWVWYCRQLSRDPYVIGATDFGWATADAAWNSFDLSQTPDMLARVQATQAALRVETPPLPEDRMLAILRARLGDRLTDDRATIYRHDTRGFGRTQPSALVGIAVHHSASGRDTTADAIARHHVDTNGWAGIGYHFVIRRGRVHYVGDVGTARAHVADRNHELIGICVTGDYTTTDPAPEDVAALRDVVGAIDAWVGRELRVDGHMGWATPGHGTACPGRLLVPARSIRTGTPTPAPAPTVDVAALVAAARAEHERAGVRLNPQSAIQRTMLADGVWPTTNEATAAGVTYARGESHAAGAWVYWWENGRVRRARIPAAAG